MLIDYDKIKQIYRQEILYVLEDYYYFEILKTNVLYLYEKGIYNVEEIVGIYYLIFIEEHDKFKEKVDNLIDKLGDNYIKILEEDIDIWEDL